MATVTYKSHYARNNHEFPLWAGETISGDYDIHILCIVDREEVD